MPVSQDQIDQLTSKLIQVIQQEIATWRGNLPGIATVPGVFDPTGMTLMLDEEFTALDMAGRWSSVPAVNDPTQNGSSLPGNGERQWYLNHAYGPTAAEWANVCHVSGGELIITAKATPEAIRSEVGYNATNNPDLQATFGPDWYDYISARLSTHAHFSHLFGYFEAEMKVPAGRGLWPAFWLLPLDLSWPPEIDVLEVLGHEPSRVFQTIHWNVPAVPGEQGGVHQSDHVEVTSNDASAGYHKYAVHWTADTITMYVDRVPTKSFTTPDHLKTKPMYVILNLAVGGSWPEWPGPVDPTALPAELRVRSVKVWV